MHWLVIKHFCDGKTLAEVYEYDTFESFISDKLDDNEVLVKIDDGYYVATCYSGEYAEIRRVKIVG